MHMEYIYFLFVCLYMTAVKHNCFLWLEVELPLQVCGSMRHKDECNFIFMFSFDCKSLDSFQTKYNE